MRADFVAEPICFLKIRVRLFQFLNDPKIDKASSRLNEPILLSSQEKLKEFQNWVLYQY